MPIVRERGTFPQWCELRRFGVVTVPAAGDLSWLADDPVNQLVVVEGSCRVVCAEGSGAGTVPDSDSGGSGGAAASPAPVSAAVHPAGASVAVPAGAWRVLPAGDPATVVTMGGRWGPDCGGSGVFRVRRAEGERSDRGDPVTYPKETAFDNHFHDCDEYWIVVSGSGTAWSEGVAYRVGPGDCVATAMGEHHDFSQVDEPVTAVFFETTMRGPKRRGHLWEHTHGSAQAPRREDG